MKILQIYIYIKLFDDFFNDSNDILLLTIILLFYFIYCTLYYIKTLLLLHIHRILPDDVKCFDETCR